MKLKDLKLENELLLLKYKEKSEEIYTYIHQNIYIFKNAIYDYNTPNDMKADHIIILAEFILNMYYIKIKSNLPFANILKPEFNYNSDDSFKMLFSIEELNKRIELNKQNKSLSKENNDYEIYSYINICNGTVIIKNGDDILSSLKFPEIECDPIILKFYERDFRFCIDILEMKFFIFKSKIEAVIDILMNDMLYLYIKKLISYKNMIKTVVTDYNCYLADDFFVWAREKVDFFVKFTISKYQDTKISGMIISYFFMLNPGLIEVFDVKKYDFGDGYYFVKWIENKFIKL